MKTTVLGLVTALLILAAGCATKPKEGGEPTPTPTPPAAQAAPTPKVSLMARVVGASFGWIGKIFPKKKETPKAEPAQIVGTVRLVNKEEKFVLIDTLTTQGAPGDLLVCIMNQKQTATLKISNFRNPPFLIADIVNGEPSKDDRVYKP